MSESELRELGEDIKANGLLSPIIIDEDDGKLIDGRNRLDAITLLGMEFEFIRAKRGPRKGKIVGIESYDFGTPLSGAVRTLFEFNTNPYDFVIGANLHRRHLTSEQKRDLIAKVLKAKPEASNRQIAKQVKAHHTTVGTVRAEMESTGEISQLDKTTGADGKKRKKPAKKRAVEPDQERRDREECVALYQKVLDAEQRATGSAEIPTEVRRAFYEATDPAVVDDQAVEILPPTPKDGNPIWLAWCKAKPSHRREFVKLAWLDIMRARQRDGGFDGSPEPSRKIKMRITPQQQ